MKIENNKLIVFVNGKNNLIDLPEVAVDVQVTAWSVPQEYRQEGVFVSVAHPGQPVEFPACKQKDALLIGTIKLEASPAAALAKIKSERLSEICSACQNAASKLSDGYPEAEVLSWPQQVAEAETFVESDLEGAPLLRALASARGIAMEELVSRVLHKKNTHAVRAGEIIGLWQKAKDMIDEAVTAEEVMAVEFSL